MATVVDADEAGARRGRGPAVGPRGRDVGIPDEHGGIVGDGRHQVPHRTPGAEAVRAPGRLGDAHRDGRDHPGGRRHGVDGVPGQLGCAVPVGVHDARVRHRDLEHDEVVQVLLVDRVLVGAELEVDAGRGGPAGFIDEVGARLVGEAGLAPVVAGRVAGTGYVRRVVGEHVPVVGRGVVGPEDGRGPAVGLEDREDEPGAIPPVARQVVAAGPYTVWLEPVGAVRTQGDPVQGSHVPVRILDPVIRDGIHRLDRVPEVPGDHVAVTSDGGPGGRLEQGRGHIPLLGQHRPRHGQAEAQQASQALNSFHTLHGPILAS
ncbi:MAG: hypothetical protein KatS3mg044_1306 [Rhodothermaceae bacterium]|nr:MAG: hypothetical protein KatS3mg044_1306 [Rhodothermaceae bacterium]